MSLAERDNCLKWDGRSPGHYEVYYLKLNHRESGCAWWLRYTLLAPQRGKGTAVAEVWGIFFDPNDPSLNRAFKQTFPAAEGARWQSEPFSFRVGERAELSHSSARGELRDGESSLAWDLRWEPCTETFYHFPIAAMYRWPIPKTKLLSPNVDLRFYGSVSVDGRTFVLSGEPGQQSHLWGSKHAYQWVWANCNAFEGHSDRCFFEGLSAQIKLGPWKAPFATLVALELDGQRYSLGGLWTAYRTRSDIALPAWSFAAKRRDIKLWGRLSARYEDFVGVEYTDPDGEKLWCNNTKVADCEVNLARRVNGRWTEPVVLAASRSAALEFVAHRKDPRIPIKI